MLELCTPIVYGSPKVAAYHRKAMDIPTNFSIINSAEGAMDDRLNILNCTEDELKVELTKPTPEAGKAALSALEKALEDYVFDLTVKTETEISFEFQNENYTLKLTKHRKKK